MLIQIEFAKSFETVAKGEKKSVDIDWQETIENLKVLITCNIDKLAASDFELYYKGKKLPNDEKISSIGYVQGTPMILKPMKKSACCILF